MIVAVVTPGVLPVPASKGGAVESLIDNLIKENEKFGSFKFEIISIFNEKAYEISQQYKSSDFIFIRPPKLVGYIDRVIYLFAKKIFKIKKNISFRYIVQRLYFINKTAKLLHNNFYDKVLIENHPSLFMVLKKKNNYIKYQGKYYYHLHNEVNNDYKCRDIINNCRIILTVSNFISQSLANYLKEINPDKLTILQNCIDTDRFSADINTENILALKSKYGIQSEEKVVIFTGRLIKEKGVKELLLAFKQIDYHNVKLLIVGSYHMDTDTSSDYEKELHQIAEDIKGHVVFTGYIPYDDMPAMYEISDISVLPSIWDEAAGQTIIESRVAGLPIITTNSGGIPEYVDDRCAVILERDEFLIDNIAKAMTMLLSDEFLRTKMAENAKNFISDASLEKYYTNFLNLIQQ